MTVSLKPYPAYKPSGVEWLGDVPVHWELQTIRAVTELKSEKNRPNQPVLSVYREYGVVPKDSRNDNHNATALDTSTYKAVEVGDLVVNKMKAWQGSMGVSEHDGIVSPAYITCRVNAKKVAPKFLHYLLRSKPCVGVYNSLSYGVRVGQWDMHYEDFKKIVVPLPKIDEQHRIAHFLDQKTAEIDEAINKKQRLIELLKEQKAILINQAVTKGLNPNVPMRDSGVEWIGEVPAHWNLSPMYARYRIELGKMLDTKRITGRHLVEYLRNTDVQWGTINTNDLPKMDITPTERERYTVKDGDLLVCEGGDIGRCAIWKGANSEIGYQKALHRMRAFDRKKENVSYLFNVMRAASQSGVFFETAKPNTISHLTGEMLKRYRFPQPPKEEQDEIVKHLGNVDYAYREVITRELGGIERLGELKSVLISQAITGKIKV